MVIRKSLQNTMGIAPDTALMLQNTMLGQSVPATGLFTPPWDCIHTFFFYSTCGHHPSFGQRAIHSPLQQMSSHYAISQ